MVSSEFFSDTFGAEVKWEPITQTITIQDKNVNIKLIIGKKEIVINGENKPIDVEPLLMFDKKMIPLKLVAEALGAQVKWNDETGNVEVVTSNIFQKTTSEYNLLRVLAEQTAKFALKTLGDKGDFMVLTNAGYAIIDNKSTSPCLDGITSVIYIKKIRFFNIRGCS
ncbi:MAG: copper amine oxidase N-terminal domain-containing protein [Thermoanaerobacteraceae bacterium]|nr:copper amine oxidase N-terminal domain-containing protein [Thermoanaerobacteraceae bacterium]